MFKIRLAEKGDLKRIVRFCKRAHAESRYKYIPIHEQTLTNTIQRLINDRHGVIWLSEVDGKIEGILMAIANQIYFSRKKEAVDLLFYVSPRAKGSGASLLRKYLSWARLTPGIERIMIGVTSGENIEITDKFYRAMGAEKVGGMYCIDTPSKDEEVHENVQCS